MVCGTGEAITTGKPDLDSACPVASRKHCLLVLFTYASQKSPIGANVLSMGKVQLDFRETHKQEQSSAASRPAGARSRAPRTRALDGEELQAASLCLVGLKENRKGNQLDYLDSF